jgi:hypothetical protein
MAGATTQLLVKVRHGRAIVWWLYIADRPSSEFLHRPRRSFIPAPLCRCVSVPALGLALSNRVLSPAERPPSGPGWLHEIKHDGMRIMARRDGAGVRLITRHGNDFTNRFPVIVAAVTAPPARSFLIDGEAIVTARICAARIPGAVGITIPKLVEMAAEQVDLASVPFATFIANKKQLPSSV